MTAVRTRRKCDNGIITGSWQIIANLNIRTQLIQGILSMGSWREDSQEAKAGEARDDDKRDGGGQFAGAGTK